jgi:hypothetical protein
MQLRMVLCAIGLCAYGLLSSATVRADGMRCGRNLVHDGERTSKVRATCGAPKEATQRVEPLTGVLHETWTYDFGPREFVRYLHFVNGVLQQIVTGDYGESR